MGLVGKPVPRIDGVKYVSGQAQYVADLRFPDMVEVAFIRSMHGHARLRNVDVGKALQHPDTLDIVTAKDIRKAVRPISTEVYTEGFKSTDVYPLARDKVRYVGEPVAAVVAKDRYVAEDIKEMINVDYEPLTPLVYAMEAIKDGAPLLHEDLGSNVLVHRVFKNGNIETSFQIADLIIGEDFRIERLRDGLALLLRVRYPCQRAEERRSGVNQFNRDAHVGEHVRVVVDLGLERVDDVLGPGLAGVVVGA